jgi:aerobic-type carbon monoxide dehydrogenase small subunit (CoxS/CutS family)
MRLMVNGASYAVDAPPDEKLISTLRDRLQLTGTKLVCGRGECGACTVLIDDVAVYSCLTLTAACDDVSITTIEGIGSEESPHPVQRAFMEHDALQCGFCTPGQILAAIALLQTNPAPTEPEIRRGMSGNLCRCGAYPKILRALQTLGSSDASHG